MIADTLEFAYRLASGIQVDWRCRLDSRWPRVYFANHGSHVDYLAIRAALPRRLRATVRPVAARDYWDSGHLRRLVARRLLDALLIERGARDPAAARTAIVSMAGALDRGQSLVLFPEGTRSHDGDIGPFKSGLYHLARLRPDTDLVPVFLDNTWRILPRGETVPAPLLARVIVGAPVRVLPGEDRTHFLARARAALVALGGGHDRTH